MRARFHRTLGAVAVLLTLTAGCAAVPRTEPVPAEARGDAAESDAVTSGPYPVAKVVDGDTIWIQRDGQNVKPRLIGIDTPETHDPRKPVQCFGAEASAQATKMLAGRQVILETDPTQGTQDRYGRELVYVWTIGGQLFNLDMIRLGFAHEYTYDLPYRYRDAFIAAERDARTAGRGLWAGDTCDGNTTKPAG